MKKRPTDLLTQKNLAERATETLFLAWNLQTNEFGRNTLQTRYVGLYLRASSTDVKINFFGEKGDAAVDYRMDLSAT